ncbi:MAG: STAS domain-containing protein [Cyanobacteriota bacterium]|nr:STAS domain-containing protein [Cyanobacteriota bacterium]
MAIVLRPHRQLDEKGAAQLRRKLEKVAKSSEFKSHSSWIVDLSEIQTLDRFGLVVLLEARRYATRNGYRFYLRNVSNSIQSLLQAALLSPEFEIWEKSLNRHESTHSLSQDCIDENSRLTTLTSPESDPIPLDRRPDRDTDGISNTFHKTLNPFHSPLNEVA